ncbi:uncharacterized protein GGS22DRAFT_184910 [Annulohypoxylon maeteangense]|uniref:uncharacterized protein n=1 Tax=Annulohypoxylon maeteangense TaxID=1927788 RepID=UPI002007BB77|nr:uncharacterized protein GGS22DRAFT_184910 [Annulohypoxylon maeteangense]KAI0889332.1 hypothetical protein GGS22DRAFT_184910 [Annulohypoxylon maeteangense]
MAVLTDLPPELIQQIAGKCSALDILALSRTCRYLNPICNNAAVFQMSFQAYLPKINSAVFKSRSTLVQFMRYYANGKNGPCPGRDGQRMTWLCLAVAATRFRDALSEVRRIAWATESRAKISSITTDRDIAGQIEKSLQGLLGFLATLPIWGCTTPWRYRDADTIQCLYNFFIGAHLWKFGTGTYLQFAFLMTMTTLELPKPSKLTDYELHHISKAYLYTTSPWEYQRANESWINKQACALFIADRIARQTQFVWIHGGTGMFRRVSPNDPTILWLPVNAPLRLPDPRKIEFFDVSCVRGNQSEGTYPTQTGFTPLQPRFPLLDPTLANQQGKGGHYLDPFCGNAWWTWYNTRVRDLLRNITEGEWCCSYIHSVGGKNYVEPTLMGIRFRYDEEGYRARVPVPVAPGAGMRLRGPVLLNAATFTFQTHNQTVSRRDHQYQGSLTPLGICGPDAVGFKIVGYFWLWRREWMGDGD